MKRICGFTLAGAVVVLAGCQLQPPSVVAPDLNAQSGYLCTAVSKTNSQIGATAWAKHRHAAAKFALNHCRAQQRSQGRCYVQNCFWTGTVTTVSNARWFTCYVENTKQMGVWSSTSHQRLSAIQEAYQRCASMSSAPQSCYVNYCRLW